MSKNVFIIVVLLVTLVLASCLPAAPSPQDVDEIVQATFQALTAQAAPPEQPQATPTEQTTSVATATSEPEAVGSLSGQLGYPSEGIPALRVVAFETTNLANFYYVETTHNQNTYQITGLPVGSYYVVAYTLGGGSFPGGLAGGYTQAVPCGLSANCTDHSLVPVSVSANQDTPDVHPKDWYAGENVFPPMPGPAPSGGTGSIAGSLSFPSEGIPALRIFAYEVGSANYYYVDTNQGQNTYQFDDLPVGYYHVVAYTLDGNLAGGYSQAVPCGLSVSCTDHSLIDVPVNIGQTATDADPGDWYAPPGAFPSAAVLP